MERIRSGDEAAMAELYDRYARVVYSAALRVLGEGAAAEDVLQDVFVQRSEERRVGKECRL